MRWMLFALALVIGFHQAALGQQVAGQRVAAYDAEVLMLGNSYTASGVDGMLRDIAASSGYTIRTRVIAPGGWGLSNHRNHAASIDSIASGQWTHVSLQDQSVLPVSEPGDFRLHAADLAQKILASGAQPVFFMTWPRREGHSIYDHPRSPGSPAAMLAALEASYGGAAKECGKWLAKRGFHRPAGVIDVPLQPQAKRCQLAPVGLAWSEALSLDPTLPLYASDGSHPAPGGVYLTALVFYAVILNEEMDTVAWKPLSLSETDAATIRAAVARVMQ